ncbi:MAG TPA: SMI1/KNR4 family protein, partial [Gemmata sp.]|nr:SMI1/KNR4 family protein [Gemmata sp.]
MGSPDEPDDLGELLARLRAADRVFRVFGSDHHRYQLGAVLSEAELRNFESAHQIKLPADYRRFLATVGNGGAGPYYGLEPLGTFGRDLSRPFP